MSFVGGSPAVGGTIDDKRAEAARLQSQLDAQAERIAVLDRQFDAAQGKASETDAAVAQARAELAESDRRLAETNGLLASAAVDAYVTGNSVSFLEQLSSADGADLSVRNQYFKTTATSQRDALDALKAAREDLTIKRTRLEQAQRSARSAAAAVNQQLQSVTEAESSQRDRLARVNGELGQLLREEQARRSARALRDAEAAASARMTVRLRAGGGGVAPALPGHAPPGGLWTCIRQRESSGNYRSGGGGAYQFRPSTWESLGGSGRAEDADPATQDAMAMKLQQRSGWSQWTTARGCGAG
jgi:peptidoglycan hydrolase CwlO-like protein